MWRLCIEDPFERSVENLVLPFDLGSTLTRPGQIQVFKAVRRATFGISTVMSKESGKLNSVID